MYEPVVSMMRRTHKGLDSALFLAGLAIQYPDGIVRRDSSSALRNSHPRARVVELEGVKYLRGIGPKGGVDIHYETPIMHGK